MIILALAAPIRRMAQARTPKRIGCIGRSAKVALALVLKAGLVLGGFAFGVAPSVAVVVYDEALSGDLPASRGPVTLGLQTGQNVIRGTWTFSGHQDPVTLGSVIDVLDVDTFSFVAPAGFHVAAISFDAEYSLQNVYHLSFTTQLWGVPSMGVYQSLSAHLYPMAYDVLNDDRQQLYDGVLPLTSGSTQMPGGVNVTYFRPGWSVVAE